MCAIINDNDKYLSLIVSIQIYVIFWMNETTLPAKEGDFNSI